MSNGLSLAFFIRNMTSKNHILDVATWYSNSGKRRFAGMDPLLKMFEHVIILVVTGIPGGGYTQFIFMKSTNQLIISVHRGNACKFLEEKYLIRDVVSKMSPHVYVKGLTLPNTYPTT